MTLERVIDKLIKYPTTSARRQAIDGALLSMITHDMQPILVVEDEGFTRFVHQLDKQYQLPSRRTVMRICCQRNMKNRSR